MECFNIKCGSFKASSPGNCRDKIDSPETCKDLVYSIEKKIETKTYEIKVSLKEKSGFDYYQSESMPDYDCKFLRIKGTLGTIYYIPIDNIVFFTVKELEK